MTEKVQDDHRPTEPTDVALRRVAIIADPDTPFRKYVESMGDVQLADVLDGLFTLGPELMAAIGRNSRELRERKAYTHVDVRIHYAGGEPKRADWMPVHAIDLSPNFHRGKRRLK